MLENSWHWKHGSKNSKWGIWENRVYHFVDRNIVQSNRFIHENEDKLNDRDIVKNVKQLKEELSKEYSHIFNKTEMLAER